MYRKVKHVMNGQWCPFDTEAKLQILSVAGEKYSL
jgi:hypothetical protein